MLKYLLHPFHFFLFSKNPYQNRIASNICDDFVPCFISIAWVHVFIAGMNFLEICGNVLRFCNIFLNISFLFSFIFILINILLKFRCRQRKMLFIDTFLLPEILLQPMVQSQKV